MSQKKLPKSIKFLDAYDKNDREIYFERDDVIKNLYDTVSRSNLTIVFGFSGTGKTSLIQCGLANAFSDSDWMEILIRKKRHATINESTFENIQNKAKTLIRPPSNGVIGKKFLKESLQSLYLDYFRTIYLIYDQFEELFIYGTESEQRDFILFLKSCLQSNLNVKVIIVIREEYLGSLYEFEGERSGIKVNGLLAEEEEESDDDSNISLPGIMDNYFRVGRMSKITVRNVIKDILEKNGIVEFETINTFDSNPEENYNTLDLIYNTIKDRETKTVDLPNLQVYLDKLLRRLPEGDKELKVQDIEAIGQLEDILTDFLEEKVTAITSDLACKKEDVWSVLNMLVSVNETKQGLKKEEIKIQLAAINE